jgi:CRP-like cAMP-binding protein
MDALRNYIESYTPLTGAEWQVLGSAFERREVARGELLVTEGAVCRYFFFLEKGLVRCFSNNDGNEVTKFFTLAPYCFTSKESFRHQLPATESIEALTNLVVWQITRQQANQLLELKAWNDFVRKFMHEVQCHFEEQLMDMKSKTAEQRYLQLQAKYGVLLEMIPLKYLSSYLGIAPQSLSRIRKKYQ